MVVGGDRERTLGSAFVLVRAATEAVITRARVSRPPDERSLLTRQTRRGIFRRQAKPRQNARVHNDLQGCISNAAECSRRACHLTQRGADRPPGAGTTILAAAPGLKAAHAGYRVYYTTAADFVARTPLSNRQTWRPMMRTSPRRRSTRRTQGRCNPYEEVAEQIRAIMQKKRTIAFPSRSSRVALLFRRPNGTPRPHGACRERASTLRSQEVCLVAKASAGAAAVGRRKRSHRTGRLDGSTSSAMAATSVLLPP
jgi:hypothetical protein